MQTYGGGLWQTWFDRDLSIAGKIIVKDPETQKLITKLIKINKPLFRIPHLAIHLTTDRNKFEWNNETHLKSIIATTIFGDDNKSTDTGLKEDLTTADKKIGKKLANLIAKELNVEKKDLYDFDIILFDTHKSTLLGIEDEFVSSGRLDNLGTSLTSLEAIINSTKNINVSNSINVIALFDNEEVGSLSYQGADSEFFGNSLLRIFNTIEDEKDKDSVDAFNAFCAKSFVISADMAHAVHPNYPEKYQNEHRPYMHKGITIKINPQSRYATDPEGSSMIKELCKIADIPCQEFIVRQDSPCGTTIGPIISGKLGIKTADIGIPQLAMHSIREICGTIDLYYYCKFFEQYFESYENVVGSLIEK